MREENCGRRRTYTYEYDAGGNMTGKYEYPLTQGEPAAFEVSRKLMTYDATGRPTVYRDHPCTWERGMLKTYSRNGIDTVYGYDAGGGRTSKTVTKQRDVVDGDGNTVKDEFGNPVTESFTVTTAYTYLGDKLIRQSDGADTLDFFYDDSGLRMINHNGTDYIVRKNIMGDVTHLYTTEGKMVGKYVYDAWGNPLRFCTSERVSQLNPILYRGYCYDPETRLYYLKTRYYDPEACRFISSDDENILLLTADHANGIMSYTYCANNPVMDTDSDGQIFLTLLIGFLVGAAVSFVSSTISQAATTGKVNWGKAGLAALFGGLGSMLMVTGIGGVVGQFFIQGGLSVIESYVDAAIDGEDIFGDEFTMNMLLNAFFSGFTAMIGAKGQFKEFKRVLQIEGTLLRTVKRDLKKSIQKGIQTWSKKSGNFLNQYVLFQIKDGLKNGLLQIFTQTGFWWTSKLTFGG